MYRITTKQGDITAQLQPAIQSITLTDESGIESDKVKMILSMEDTQLPERGHQFALSIGDVARGTFTVRRIEYEGVPDRVIMIANAVDHSGVSVDMKSVRNACFPDGKLGDFLSAMAARHGYQSAIDAALAEVTVDTIIQSNESDLACLQRLGTTYHAYAGIKSGHLIFKPKGTVHSVTGKTLATHTINKASVSRYRVPEDDKKKYNKTTVRYRDLQGGTTESVSLGEGKPEYVDAEIMPSQHSAQQRVQKLHEQHNRAAQQLEIEMAGDAKIHSEHRIKLEGFYPRITVDWVASKTVHTLAKTFTTTIHAQPYIKTR